MRQAQYVRLSLLAFPRYNQNALRTLLHPNWLFAVVAFCALWLCSCATPLGPGYLVEKQELRVQFAAASQSVHVEAEYQLRNIGHRAIFDLEILLPIDRRVHLGLVATKWDGSDIVGVPTPGTPRNSTIHLPQTWAMSAQHTLHISYDILSPDPSAGSAALTFASDAFYLPAAGWCPVLLPAHGLLGFGGGPPKNWDLLITVPQGFVVHSSGSSKKARTEKNGALQTFRARQTLADRYPFVVAGRYTATEIRSPRQNIILWSRASQGSAVLQQASAELARTLDAYNSMFGAPTSRVSAFWIVECPVAAACFSNFTTNISAMLDDGTHVAPFAELASFDSVMVDVSKGAPQVAAAAAPQLAASWLGYGRNPGFYQQTEPLSLLPIFAAATSREGIDGPQVRGETIRRVLRYIPENTAAASPPLAGTAESVEVLRAKSLLFFYGLQDRYGAKVFHDAIAHMLSARASRDLSIDDLIAAFEQETHQNVAEFLRHWMKRPGVPADFRARYQQPNQSQSTAAATSSFHQQSFLSKGDLP